MACVRCGQPRDECYCQPYNPFVEMVSDIKSQLTLMGVDIGEMQIVHVINHMVVEYILVNGTEPSTGEPKGLMQYLKDKP